MERSFLNTAAKYLFPFVLEYSLLALGEVVLIYGQLKSSRRLSFIHRLRYLISHQALTSPSSTLVTHGHGYVITVFLLTQVLVCQRYVLTMYLYK
jgi:hypothetical protein